MEGLRGYAVFLVFLVHYASLVQPYITPTAGMLNDYLHIAGNIGVDLFFVLSGYLIYGSLIKREQPFLGFMMRRVQRIYPAFTVVFLMYIVLSMVFPRENKIPSDPLGGAIYLLENFLLLPGIFPITPIITVAWTLSYEIFFYLLIPILIASFQLRKKSPRWRVAFFMSLTALYAGYCTICGGHIRLIMFVAGIILFETIDNSLVSNRRAVFGYIAIAFSFVVPVLPVDGKAGDVFRAVLLFWAFYEVCYHCFIKADSLLSAVFIWTPLRWLGNMSYSYYLIHGLTLKAAFLIFAKLHLYELNITSHLVLMAIMFAVTLLPAIALYVCVERPFSLKKGRK